MNHAPPNRRRLLALLMLLSLSTGCATMGGAMPDTSTPGANLESRALAVARVTVRTAAAYADAELAARYANACAPVAPPPVESPSAAL